MTRTKNLKKKRQKKWHSAEIVECSIYEKGIGIYARDLQWQMSHNNCWKCLCGGKDNTSTSLNSISVILHLSFSGTANNNLMCTQGGINTPHKQMHSLGQLSGGFLTGRKQHTNCNETCCQKASSLTPDFTCEQESCYGCQTTVNKKSCIFLSP